MEYAITVLTLSKSMVKRPGFMYEIVHNALQGDSRQLFIGPWAKNNFVHVNAVLPPVSQ